MAAEDSPGIIVSFLRSTFGFRKTTLSFLILLSYFVSILTTVYYEKKALTVPTPEPEILNSAWLDLQSISQTPHPYGSHANDDVHDYILSRVKELAKLSKDGIVEVSDDYNSSSIFKQIDVFNSANPVNQIIYFESGNVLVKIAGEKPSLEGILLSAHYDSVPSAYGTTDDGMGIASMLGVLEHFVTTGEKPLRNIVFNFNNDEEFGLLGASVFFDHEWSKLVKYFVNLEGTGAGGRAVLFRGTDNGIVSYYNSVRSPFGNSLFQQGFQSGLIRSETDYKIYLEKGLRGLDIAFYQPRNLYHTKFDSIQGSSKGALWHMLSNALDVVLTLSNAEAISTDTSASVFFDVLGLKFFNISVETLYIANIVLLTLTPVVVIILLILVAKRRTWFVGFSRGWLRLPISLFSSIVAVFSLTNLIEAFNPSILTSNWFSVLIASASLFILVNYLVINFFSWWIPVHDQKLIAFLELSFFLWILLIGVTVRQHFYSLSGEYAITAFYVMVSLSTIFGLLSLVFKSRPSPSLLSKKDKKPNYGSIEEERQPLIEEERSGDTEVEPEQDAGSAHESAHHSTHQSEQESVKSEPESPESFEQKLKSAALKSFSYDWSIQFLIFVPLSILLTYSLGELGMQGLHLTGQQSDLLGHSTFKLLSIFAVGLGIPLLPFIHKLNFFLFLLVAISFLVGALISLNEAPFNSNEPLKISFMQTIDLTQNPDDATVYVYGKNEFLEDIVKDLPTVARSEKSLTCEETKDGNGVCSFIGERPWLVDGSLKDNKFENYLKIEVIHNDNNETLDKDKHSPYAPLSADFKIFTPDNRNCILNFNSSKFDSIKKASDKSLVSPVKTIKIYHDGDSVSLPNASVEHLTYKRQEPNVVLVDGEDLEMKVPTGPSYDSEEDLHVYRLLKGIDNVQLHKVNFTAPYYHIGVEWIPNFDFDLLTDDGDASTSLGISVTCFWGEYETSSIVKEKGGHYSAKKKIPAYDELLLYSPDYVSVSNSAKGLVSVKNYVEL